MPNNKFVQCVFIDPAYARRFEGGVTQLERTRAERLQSQGIVKIVGKISPLPIAAKKVSPAEYLIRKDYARTGGKKIAWVQDYSKQGGAELSNCTVVAVGESLGFDIVGVTPRNFPIKLLYDADLIVVNNFFEFTQEQVRQVYHAIYEMRIPYVKYEHDYREMGRENTARQLFGLARACVYLSPAHARRHTEKICSSVSITLPLAIDIDTVIAEKKETTPGICLVPCFRKGPALMSKYIQENPKTLFTVIGTASGTLLANASFMGQLPYHQLLHEMSRHEKMLHLPSEPWAGERIFLEARLLGCKTIVNENVGHSSWAEEDITISKLRKAPFAFWEMICRCL
jgi:hypothetical protein